MRVCQVSDLTKRPTALLAVLRTTRVWVDRPTLYTTYTLHDEDGSFRVDTSGSFGVTLTTASSGGSCSHSTLASQVYRHLAYCTDSVASTAFTSLTAETNYAVAMAVTPGDGSTNLHADLGNVVLTPPPSWWDATLRTTTTGARSSAPAHIASPAFVTLPTHPVYASASGVTDHFEAIVFANKDTYEVESWTIEVVYDPAKLTFISYELSTDYSSPTVADSTSGGLAVKTLVTTAPSAEGAANPARRKGVFYMVSLRFQIAEGVPAGTHSDLISVEVVNFINSANNAFLTTQMARVVDHRDDTAYRFHVPQPGPCVLAPLGLALNPLLWIPAEAVMATSHCVQGRVHERLDAGRWDQ